MKETGCKGNRRPDINNLTDQVLYSSTSYNNIVPRRTLVIDYNLFIKSIST